MNTPAPPARTTAARPASSSGPPAWNRQDRSGERSRCSHRPSPVRRLSPAAGRRSERSGQTVHRPAWRQIRPALNPARSTSRRSSGSRPADVRSGLSDASTARNAKGDGDRGGWFIHRGHSPTLHQRGTKGDANHSIRTAPEKPRVNKEQGMTRMDLIRVPFFFPFSSPPHRYSRGRSAGRVGRKHFCFPPGRARVSPPPPPLKSVHASFNAYGSSKSLAARILKIISRGGFPWPVQTGVWFPAGGSTGVPVPGCFAPPSRSWLAVLCDGDEAPHR